MRLLLITGFLGAGKTTFLRRLLALYQNSKLALIVNEFGRVNVDGALLHKQGVLMHEVTGGSVFCSCRADQFEAALHAAAAENPDLVLIEASGLSDPTMIKTVVGGFPSIEYAGCIALCDALRLEKTLAAVRVSLKQLGISDLILLNKADLVSQAEVERLTALLHERFPQARVEAAVQGGFSPEWLENLRACAPAAPYRDTRDITLQKACAAISPAMTLAELTQFIRLFAEDTYRVKGIVALAEGTFLADCVGAAVSITPYEASRADGHLVALAGAGMNLRKSLKQAQQWYPDKVTELIFGS